MLDVVRRTAEGIFMPLTVGGGMRSLDDIRGSCAPGADKVSLNTAALSGPPLIEEAADALRQPVHRGGHRRELPGEPPRRGKAPESSRSRSASPRRPLAATWHVYTHGGRRPAGATPWRGRARSSGWARARSC